MCFSLAESEWFSLTEITLLQSSAKLWICCKSAHWAPGSWFETRLNQAHKAARGGTIKDANLSAELVKGGSCSEKWSGRFASSLIWEVWFEKQWLPFYCNIYFVSQQLCWTLKPRAVKLSLLAECPSSCWTTFSSCLIQNHGKEDRKNPPLSKPACQEPQSQNPVLTPGQKWNFLR